MKKIISFIICMLLLTGCGNKFYTIDSNEAMELINNNGAIVIDVREAWEYATGHIKDSVNISVNNISNIDYDKEKYIILYCATGVRSSEAANKLVSNGYVHVYNLDGGLINWGFELTK